MSNREEKILKDLATKCNKRIQIEEQIKARIEHDKVALIQSTNPKPPTIEDKKNCCCLIT